MDSTRVGIRNGIEFPAYICLCTTSSPLSRCNHTFVGARSTLDRVVSKLGVEIGLFYMSVSRRESLLGPSMFPWEKHGTTGCAEGSLYELSAGCFHKCLRELYHYVAGFPNRTFNPRLIVFKMITETKTPIIPILGIKIRPVNIVPQAAPARSAT